MSELVLRLYVAGRSRRTEDAIANLRELCQNDLDGRRYRIEVIDVIENPQLAEDAKILATPTVIRQLPLPIRRVIGDMSDKARVLVGLDLRRSES